MSTFRKVVKKMFAELSNRDKIKLQFKSNLRMINKIRQKNNRQQVRVVYRRWGEREANKTIQVQYQEYQLKVLTMNKDMYYWQLAKKRHEITTPNS